MRTLRSLRNIAFVLMLGAGIAAMETRLLAAYSIDDCAGWSGGYDCSCDDGPPSWSGTCDFSETSDPLGLANEFCISTFSECISSCESSEWAEEVAEANCNPWDPRTCDPDCYATYAAENSCNAGETSDFSCSCDYYLWCEPE
jgi:hypothetical protein